MFFQLRSGRRGPNQVTVVFLVGAAAFFLFFCSGLHFPIWDAQGRLANRLTEDLGVSLPAGSKVTHAVREASHDPGEFYSVEIPSASVLAFMGAVRAAGIHSKEADATKPAGVLGRTPSWWTPQNLPQVQRLDMDHHDGQGGYIWYYSPVSSTVYVFWFRT
jgi:hypothetical protein